MVRVLLVGMSVSSDGYQSKGACSLINVFLRLVFLAFLQLFDAVGFSIAIFELYPLFR